MTETELYCPHPAYLYDPGLGMTLGEWALARLRLEDPDWVLQRELELSLIELDLREEVSA